MPGALALLLLWQDKPEQTLKNLEERLLKARTLQLAFKAEAVVSQGDGKTVLRFEASLRVKGPAKFRLEGKTGRGDDLMSGILVSDGEKLVAKGSGGSEERKPMKDSAERFAVLFARVGLLTSAALAMENADRDPHDEDQEYLPDLRRLAAYADFAAAGERCYRYAVVYRKAGEEADSRATVTVWLDAAGFPSKRRTEHESGARKVVAEETYEGWKLDEELADDVFKP